ncbi:XRE family transcriptional regulator [Apibacter muscae]|nr:XRE family transcriptional regulator [Apibacter muscae]
MKNNKQKLEKILETPSYWVEAINGELYNSIVEYMKKNNMNQTQLAEYFNISKGRISQILNDGDINFKIEKIIEIALKVDKFPIIKLEDKEIYLESKTQINNIIPLTYNYNNVLYSEVKDDNIEISKGTEEGYLRFEKSDTDVFKLAIS